MVRNLRPLSNETNDPKQLTAEKGERDESRTVRSR